MLENLFGSAQDPHEKLFKELWESFYNFVVANPLVSAAATIIIAQVYKWVSPFFKDKDEGECEVDVANNNGFVRFDDDDDDAYRLDDSTRQELITRIQDLENREGTESVRKDVVELYRLVNFLDRATGQVQQRVAALEIAEQDRKKGAKLS